MSEFDLSQEWNLSAPERERLRQKKMRYLQRIRDERDIRIHGGTSQDNADTLMANVVREIEQRVTRLNNEIMQQQAMTIEEIRQLQDLLDIAKAEYQMVLDNAYIAADGRRVFKDKHGNVYTQNGDKVGKDIVDPNAIGEDYSSWEAHQKALNKVNDLDNRLDLNHQKLEQLDADQDALNSDDLTQDKLDAIENRLEVSKLDTPLEDELDINPEILPPNPTVQFKIAAATMPPSSRFNLDNLEINAPGLNG